ncbi:hypothetical protein EXIGLDRAFT_778672 [Exidia glandulosa HHB12029]|uniref:N-acetyltransferase domain-containing protein n=1 Tax=Exidia glandulosa HHB12029 TaxID=1314781 RepID=A0A165CF27_EXIGL|nr:hypothetical protein EXIGLDRAFT_778672 [Exidia glandulosa HHB12029]
MPTPPTPRVNGQPTTLHTLTHSELAHSPLLEPLCNLINAAFQSTHGAPYVPSTFVRFHNTTHMLAEIKTTSTVYVLTQNERILGSITDEPYDDPSNAHDEHCAEPASADFHPDVPLDEGEGVDRRVLRLLVTDPTIHRQGIGSFLVDVLDAGMVRRAKEKHATHVLCVLTTLKEVNGAYYERRGWKLVNARLMPAGYLDSSVPMTIATMVKRVEL